MAVFRSLQRTPPNYPVSGVGVGGRTIHTARAVFDSVAPLTTTDSLELFELPANARIMGGWVKTGDLDTGASFAFNVGFAAAPAVILAASVIGQTGGVVTQLAASAYDFLTTAKTLFTLVPTANAAGWTNGRIQVVLHYFVDEPA
jgi:hypothetical protein